jgi:hypothetical protein
MTNGEPHPQSGPLPLPPADPQAIARWSMDRSAQLAEETAAGWDGGSYGPASVGRAMTWWCLVVALVAAAAAVALFQPIALGAVHLAGINTDPPPSCTMERVAECTVKDGPGLVVDAFAAIVVVGALVLAAGVAGVALLVSIPLTVRSRRRAVRRPPAFRAAAGAFLVTFAATGVWFFAAH